MNGLKELRTEALRLIDQYPAKSDEIRGYYQLALDEIEEGGSESHECSLAYRDMLDCLND
jgi:hypothetical protein